MIDKNLGPEEKHFKKLIIKSAGKYLFLDDSSFSNITFDEFEGSQIKQISSKAFGKASSTIKKFKIHNVISDLPPKYSIWKMISGLVNVEYVYLNLDINEIPSFAFGKQLKLKQVNISTFNRIKVQRRAFYKLDNLKSLYLISEISKVDDEAFAFENESSQRVNIIFYVGKIKTFMPKSFSGIQRPVNIVFMEIQINHILESTFKSVLSDNNNQIEFISSTINCTNCFNYWLIREGKDNQVKNASCNHNTNQSLFSNKTKSNLKLECNLGNCIKHCNILLIYSLIIINIVFVFNLKL